MALLTPTRGLQKGDLVCYCWPEVFYDDDDKPYVSADLYLAVFQSRVDWNTADTDDSHIPVRSTQKRLMLHEVCCLTIIDRYSTGTWYYSEAGDRSQYFLEPEDLLGRVVGTVDMEDPYSCLRILRRVAQQFEHRIAKEVEDCFWKEVLL